MIKKFFKKENGAITLFVLLAMLFFLIVIFSVFISTSNKKQSQISEIDEIKKEYEQSVNNIDAIYNSALTVSNVLKVGDVVRYDTGNPNVGDNGVIDCIVLYDTAYNRENPAFPPPSRPLCRSLRKKAPSHGQSAQAARRRKALQDAGSVRKVRLRPFQPQKSYRRAASAALRSSHGPCALAVRRALRPRRHQLGRAGRAQQRRCQARRWQRQLRCQRRLRQQRPRLAGGSLGLGQI